MVQEKKTSYPLLAAKSWWTLRRKFHDTVPGTVSASYLSSALNMNEDSAKTNVLVYLKSIGLVGQDGKPTDLANKWRLDDSYAKVCEEIRQNTYPQEILDLFPKPVAEDRENIARWFMAKTKAGDTTAKMMTAFYMLLSEADPTKGEVTAKASSKPPIVPKERPASSKTVVIAKPADKAVQGKRDYPIADVPSVHIDIQIHLSPDTTAEQIDQIFASMAKHLRNPNPAVKQDG